MKKAIYITLLSLITVFCIIWGTWKNVSGAFKKMGHYFWSHKDDYIELDEDTLIFTNNETKLEPFSKIEGDFKVASFTLKQGNDFSVSYDANNKYNVPVFSVVNGEFVIEQKSHKKFRTGNNSCKIVVTVPENHILDFFDVQVDVGEIEIKNANIEKIKCEVDVGDFKITNTPFSKADLEVDIGEICISNCFSQDEINDYALSLETSIGEVQAFSHTSKSYKTRGSSSKYITADVDVGSIYIK